MRILDYFTRKKADTASVAKERLQIIVAHERKQREQPEYLPQLQKDIMDVIRKYVEIDQVDDIGPQVEFLDVRLPVEHKHFCVRGSRNIALGKLRERLPSLDPGLTYVVTDDGGSRSKVAVQLLIQSGLSAVLLNHSDKSYQ